MNKEIDKEKTPSLDRMTFLAEIERLYLEGYPTREIAQLLGEDGNKVGRNLREIRRRWACAARRQRTVLSQTQCAAVYREAMSGWRRSQEPKFTTTEHHDANGDAVKTTTRRQEGPGDKAFLQAALGALKNLRQFAAEPASDSAKDGKPTDLHYMALLEILTPEQLDRLDADQIRAFRAALNRMQAFHARMERLAEGRQDGPAGSAAADEAGLSSEPAPQDPSEDTRPNDGAPAAAPAEAQPAMPSAPAQPLETRPDSEATERTSSILAGSAGACAAEPARAEPEEPCATVKDERPTKGPADDPCPAVAAVAQAAAAAPATAISAPGVGAPPYPPIPLPGGKPPTPEGHLAYQQWQDHLRQSLILGPLFGSALQQPPPQASPASAARGGA